MLLGSSVLLSTFMIGDVCMTLGEIVYKAYDESGLLAHEWNSLDPLKREIMLVKTIYIMRAEAEARRVKPV